MAGFDRPPRKQPGAEEYVEYFPVAAVAALETLYRGCVRDLVDAGPPYSGRADAVIRDAKVDLPVLLGTHGRKISVGEFVGHLAPFKSFGDVDFGLSTLLGRPLIDAIKHVEDPWEMKKGADAKVLPSHGPVFADVNSLIAARHQLAHEVLNEPPIADLVVLQRQLSHLERFGRAIAEVVSQTLHPNAPLTQADINEAAGQQAVTAEQAMKRAYEGALARADAAEREALEASQKAFMEYRRRSVDHAGTGHAGGSIRPTVESLEFERLTKRRTKDLLRLQEPAEQQNLFDEL